MREAAKPWLTTVQSKTGSTQIFKDTGKTLGQHHAKFNSCGVAKIARTD
jgi:hypothetical protein